MAEQRTLARPYAKAAFEYARDHGQLDAWQRQLGLAAAVAATAAVDRVLGNPSLTAGQQAAAIVDVCGDELSPPLHNFLHILAENRRLRLVPEIAELFAQLKAAAERSVDVDIASAFEIPDHVRERLAGALRQRLDRDVKVRSAVDPSLLGGIVIRAGDTVIDGSVRGRLAKLAEAMNS